MQYSPTLPNTNLATYFGKNKNIDSYILWASDFTPRHCESR